MGMEGESRSAMPALVTAVAKAEFGEEYALLLTVAQGIWPPVTAVDQPEGSAGGATASKSCVNSINGTNWPRVKLNRAEPRPAEPSCNWSTAAMVPPQAPSAVRENAASCGAPPAASTPQTTGPLRERTPPVDNSVATKWV